LSIGGPIVRFTIGAGDKQALQPVTNSMIPQTRRTVAILFQELGKWVGLGGVKYKADYAGYDSSL